MTDPLATNSPPGRSDRETRADLMWFAVWSGIGAQYALAVVGVMTIGIFVVPFAVAATVYARRHRRSSVGVPGLFSGAALPPLYIAYLNRGGPGTVCSAILGGQSCTDEWSPWPWLALGVVLLITGMIVFARRRKRRAPGTQAITTAP